MKSKNEKPFKLTCLWTDSLNNFTCAVVTDFFEDVADVLAEEKISIKDFCKKIEISEKKWKSLYDHPTSISMALAVKISRALNKKVCLLLYDEGEDSSPVFSEAFRACWKKCGEPKTGWELEEVEKARIVSVNRIRKNVKNVKVKKNCTCMNADDLNCPVHGILIGKTK